MKQVAPFATAVAVAVLLAAGATRVSAAKPDRPELTLRPMKAMAFAPAKLVLVGQIKGGPDSLEDLYCPSVEWEWGDDTRSEASSDCEPFEPGKSTIQRMFIVEHVFKHGGSYAVRLTLKKHNKVVATAEADIQLMAAVGDDNIIR